MTHRNATQQTGKRGRFFQTTTAATLGLALLMPALANAQGVLVRDGQGNARLGQIANDTTTINAQTGQVVQATEEMADALGPAGSLPSPTSGALGGAVGSGSEFYENMQRFSYDMCAVTLCANSDPVGTTDIDEARDWAMENFFADDILNEPTRRDLLEIRRRAVVYGATNGLALAVTIHNELAGADGTANALEAKIAESGTLRHDVQANSAILLAQYKVALQELAVMNATLVVLASGSIRGADIYHEEGGNNFADAINDNDFSDPGFSVRTQVTPPQRGGGGALNLLP